MTKVSIEFAHELVTRRLAGFRKDVEVCLQPLSDEAAQAAGVESGKPAYFPALALCCAMVEFIGALYDGDPDKPGLGRESMEALIRDGFLSANEYSDKVVKVLWGAFRNKIAHFAHPYWVTKVGGMRLSLVVSIHPADHAVVITKAPPGTVVSSHPVPWEVPISDIAHVSIPKLRDDIVAAGEAYATALANTSSPDHKLRMKAIEKAVRRFMPPAVPLT